MRRRSWFVASALLIAGCSATSTTTLVDGQLVPPQNVEVVTLSDTSFRLTWTAVPGASSYGLYAFGTEWHRTSETSWETELEVGGVYVFNVVAIDEEGRLSGPSSAVTLVPAENEP